MFTVIVLGVAQLGDDLYVMASDVPLKILVYDTNDYESSSVIEMPDVEHAIDIVACQKTQQLYVADFTCVLSVFPDGEYGVWLPAEFPTSDFSVSSISVTEGRLLVASYMEQHLLLYNEYRQEIARVELPSYMMPLHATESASGTVILSHLGTLTDLSYCKRDFFQICEVGLNGEILQTFGDLNYTSHSALQSPRYIVLASGGRMFVADSGKRRVLLISSGFQLECVLVDDLQSDPQRLCYNEYSSRLTVADFYGGISVYDII